MIIANAGVMATPLGKTEDGFETQFGTNHLGHFVFVNRIAKLIKDGGRLVNLSSAGHRYSDADLNDPNSEATPYAPFVAYGRSKTANVLFAVEFDRRHCDRGVRATAVHPGGIATSDTEVFRDHRRAFSAHPDRPRCASARKNRRRCAPLCPPPPPSTVAGSHLEGAVKSMRSGLLPNAFALAVLLICQRGAMATTPDGQQKTTGQQLKTVNIVPDFSPVLG